MAIFEADQYRDHQQVSFFRHPGSGLYAIIAIHRARDGIAGGGLRMKAYGAATEAVADVLRLSRAMTYKFALANIPLGGAKAVIIANPATDKTDALLTAFGDIVNSLNGRYICGPDVGTTSRDMGVIRRRTRHVRGLPGESGDTSPATAWGVYHAMRAAARFRLKRGDLDGLTVAVQGVGGVGGRLCGHLRDAGCRLIVADVDAGAAARMAETHGAKVVAPDAILSQEADILAPCALGGGLNERSIPAIRAAIVCGGANNQLATDDDGGRLWRRRVLYVPDYAANAGGVINGTREGPGYDKREALRVVEGIHDTVLAILTAAAEEDIPTNVAADRLAEARLNC